MITPLECMVNHVFLPPKLPLQEDGDSVLNMEHELCTKLLRAAKEFNLLPRNIIQLLQTVVDTRSMTEYVICQSMSGMKFGGTCHISFILVPILN